MGSGAIHDAFTPKSKFMKPIFENLELVKQKLRDAAERSGRPSSDVELLAVSKTFPPRIIQEAADAGQTLFGENKVQELIAKVPALPSHLRWHFIGHLQSNKIRKILPLTEAIHSIDSVDLATQVDRIAGELGLHPQVYIQVNIADDGAKFGFSPAECERALDSLLDLPRLEFVGLMTVPAFDPDPEKTRRHFAALREFRDRLAPTVSLPRLSMGMSHDFEVAVEEGATIVRVGSQIFGAR